MLKNNDWTILLAVTQAAINNKGQ